jgi:hypothetical protein
MNRPCLDCGTPTPKARCPRCTRTKDQARGTSTQRGYGHAHQQRRTATIDSEPWCHNPTCDHPDAGAHTNPLTLEHLDPTDRHGPATVLCHRCNSARRHDWHTQ